MSSLLLTMSDLMVSELLGAGTYSVSVTDASPPKFFKREFLRHLALRFWNQIYLSNNKHLIIWFLSKYHIFLSPDLHLLS